MATKHSILIKCLLQPFWLHIIVEMGNMEIVIPNWQIGGKKLLKYSLSRRNNFILCFRASGSAFLNLYTAFIYCFLNSGSLVQSVSSVSWKLQGSQITGNFQAPIFSLLFPAKYLENINNTRAISTSMSIQILKKILTCSTKLINIFLPQSFIFLFIEQIP